MGLFGTTLFYLWSSFLTSVLWVVSLVKMKLLSHPLGRQKKWNIYNACLFLKISSFISFLYFPSMLSSCASLFSRPKSNLWITVLPYLLVPDKAIQPVYYGRVWFPPKPARPAPASHVCFGQAQCMQHPIVWLPASSQPGQQQMLFDCLHLRQIQILVMQEPCLVVCAKLVLVTSLLCGMLTTSYFIRFAII